MTINYAFVIDAEGKQLSPTKETKAWYLIRKGKAKLISKYPMVIQLRKTVIESDICKDEVRCSIDDGGLHTGIALVQKGITKNKVIFKGTIEHRKDVKKLMDQRRGYRRHRRYYKKYREKRYNNRSSGRRKGRIAPSILQKRQAVIRVINSLQKWTIVNSYWLEDVSIDIRVLTDGYIPYEWQNSNFCRIDENIRKSVIIRDGNRCQECGKTNCKLEVHHIVPRRMNGSSSMSNLITLCEKCHQNTFGKEHLLIKHYLAKINEDDVSNLKYASHSMIGKTWLRENLAKLGSLHLTNGGETANKRIDWMIQKSHSNDAICITDLFPDTCDLKEWIIKPMRRRSQAKTDSVMGFKHRDFVEYTYKNGKTYRGYVTALFPKNNTLSFKSLEKTCTKVNAAKCKLIWKYNKIYWFEQ